jgi:hypothetical protein
LAEVGGRSRKPLSQHARTATPWNRCSRVDVRCRGGLSSLFSRWSRLSKEALVGEGSVTRSRPLDHSPEVASEVVEDHRGKVDVASSRASRARVTRAIASRSASSGVTPPSALGSGSGSESSPNRPGERARPRLEALRRVPASDSPALTRSRSAGTYSWADCPQDQGGVAGLGTIKAIGQRPPGWTGAARIGWRVATNVETTTHPREIAVPSAVNNSLAITFRRLFR